MTLVDNDVKSGAQCPSEPLAFHLSHDSASFTWNAGSNQHSTSKEFYVHKYIVRLSTAELERDGEETNFCSHYDVHEHILSDPTRSNDNATTSMSNLHPQTSYCLQVEAFSVEGLSLGKRVLPFTTRPAPVNEWIKMDVRQTVPSDISANSVNDEQSWCEYSSIRPTGRRGHSMAVINDQAYIFGGATVKCGCSYDSFFNETRCSRKNVYSDELWQFDTVSSRFSLLHDMSSIDETTPRGREQHSATVMPDGSLVVIGGMTSFNDDLTIDQESNVLGDVWRLPNPHHTSSFVFSGIGDEARESQAMELTSGKISKHRLYVSSEEDVEMCIADIQVKISLDHDCPKDIHYISLIGPDNSTGINAHESKYRETKLYISSNGSQKNDCHASTLNLVFSDKAYDSILSYSDIPTAGEYRPANSLMSMFDSWPVDGEWTVGIAQSQSSHLEEHRGRVLDWELRVKGKPCHAKANWQQLSRQSNFPPRRMHTAVAIGNSIFVSGGFSDHHLDDLWRFDYGPNTWTELNASASGKPLPMNGQTALLGQFGLLVYGGIQPLGTKEHLADLWLLDVFENEWSKVPIARNHSMPRGRYLSTIGMCKSHDVDRMDHVVIVFGGDGGLLHNSYQDSYGFMSNAFFQDVWMLSLGGISGSMKERHREEHCDWRLSLNSTAQREWNASCGWSESKYSSPDECSWDEILVMAWCKEQYQSFYMEYAH